MLLNTRQCVKDKDNKIVPGSQCLLFSDWGILALQSFSTYNNLLKKHRTNLIPRLRKIPITLTRNLVLLTGFYKALHDLAPDDVCEVSSCTSLLLRDPHPFCFPHKGLTYLNSRISNVLLTDTYLAYSLHSGNQKSPFITKIASHQFSRGPIELLFQAGTINMCNPVTDNSTISNL